MSNGDQEVTLVQERVYFGYNTMIVTTRSFHFFTGSKPGKALPWGHR
jgi:3-deoxy-D-manno-octulosonic acid (KDO) 8-phosphate synthase